MKRNVWAVGLAMLLLLSGCNPDSGSGSLEMVYPSGYTRTNGTWDELAPVEGTGYQLQAQKSSDYDKTHNYDLQILDEAGDLQYTLPGIGRPTMRGEAAEGGTAWVCSEWWDTVHNNGYLNGHLTKSVVLLVDMMDGEVLFQAEIGKNELYLTSKGSLCYFYKIGKSEQENAQICCRDIQDWETEQCIYTFDYAVEPDITEYNDSRTKARFILGDDSIQVIWESTDRILTSEGKYQSVFSEKVTYEVSLLGAVQISNVESM